MDHQASHQGGPVGAARRWNRTGATTPKERNRKMDVQTIMAEVEQDVKNLFAFLDAGPELGEVYETELYSVTVTQVDPTQVWILFWFFDQESEEWERVKEYPIKRNINKTCAT
jgi:hypothetical protein